MNRTMLLPLALGLAFVIAGCSTPPNEVTQVKEGVLRAPTYVQADDYCKARQLSPKWLGPAQAQQGILFQCN